MKLYVYVVVTFSLIHMSDFKFQIGVLKKIYNKIYLFEYVETAISSFYYRSRLIPSDFIHNVQV